MSIFQNHHRSVLEAGTKSELQDQFVRFAQKLGFQTVTAIAVIDRFRGAPEFNWIDNAPDGYAALANDPNRNRRDPVMQHCKRKSVPITWDQSTYLAAGQAEKWEEQARFGYRNGICFALHLPAGRHFCFGVDRDQPLPNDSAEISRMVSALLMFAVYAQDASMRILLTDVPADDGPRLSGRELETLRWTLEGKTAWEIGQILSIAEDTAARHAYNATQKLGCANKHHAAVRALRLGLIQ